MVTQLVLNVVATLVVAVAYLRLVGYGRPVFERGTFVEVVRYGVTSHLGNIALQVNARYDQIVMASVLPAYQLSPCLTAVSAAAFIQTLAIAVRSVVVPRIVRTPELSEKRAMLTRFLRGYVAAATALFLLLAVAVPFVIPLVYGDDFRDAIPAAEILLVGGWFVGLRAVLFAGAQAIGNPWLGSKAELLALALALTLLLIVPMVLWISIVGAAIVSVVAYAAAAVMVAVNVRRGYGFAWWH